MLTSLNSGLKLACRCGHQTARMLHTSRQLWREDYYKVLGVPRNASQKDIKKAYYEMAKQYHPDTNQGNPKMQQKFQEVSEAYEVLSDEAKRQEYDRFGAQHHQAGYRPGAGQTRQGGGGGTQWSYQSNVDPEELFRQIFGEFSRGFGQSRGSNPFEEFFNFEFRGGVQATCHVTFLEAARGSTKEVEVLEMGGHFRGPSFNKRSLLVPIPAGISDGQTLRLTLGSSEVFVTVRVEESEYFRRVGYDVHTDANISLSQAILGGIIRLQGLYEDLNIRIPAGTSSHTEFTLSGRGIRHLETHNSHGDHIVHIHIKMPVKLSPEQREIMEEFARLETDTPGTVNGVDKSMWGGIRKRRDAAAASAAEEKETKKAAEEEEEQPPGILQRLKKAIFG